MTDEDRAALLDWAEAGRVPPEVLAELLRRCVSYGDAEELSTHDYRHAVMYSLGWWKCLDCPAGDRFYQEKANG